MRLMVNNRQFDSPVQKLLPYFLVALVTSGLYASSLHSYLLFHSIVEILCVVILLVVFVVAWNVRELMDNHYILFVGLSFLSSASLEIVHMFAYKGFGVFPDDDANLPTQLWISFRYMYSLSFLIAPVFISRRMNTTAATTIFAGITAVLFAAIFFEVFPDCFIEGKGLTPFKIYSEYIIILILFAALGLLISKRTLFDPHILRTLALSIVCAAAADVAFVHYLSVYGPANLIGHIFLFLSAVLVYRAIIVTGFKDPLAIIFRNLEQSKEQFRLIAETGIDLIFQLDGAGKVEFCSPAISQYGYRVADVVGTDFRVYVAPDDLESATTAFKRVIEGETIKALKLGLLTAAGATYYAEINATPLRMNGVVAGIQGVSRDITARRAAELKLESFANELKETNAALDESRAAAFNLMQDAVVARTHAETINEVLQHEVRERRQAEEALREHALRYRLATEATGVGVWEWNIKANQIRWDNQMFRIYGIAPTIDGMVDYSVWCGAVLPEDLPAQEVILQDTIRQGGQSIREFCIRRHDDGECRVIQAVDTVRINDQGRTEWVVGTNLDITERRQFEEKLRESEALYRGIGESIDYGVWICAPDGRNTYASESFLRMVGITQEQCSNFGWGDVLHPDDADRTIAAWRECVRTGGTWDIEHRFRGADDQWHHVLARGVPVRNEQGTIICWAGINLDISRLKQVEEQVRASLAEKEVMLREIHHRVKNNLQVISSLINLQIEHQADEKVRSVFGETRDRVRSLALVHEKLYQTGELAQLKFAEYAASLLRDLWRSHGALAENIRLNIAMDPVLLPVETAVPCGLILNELANNALKHAFPQGSGQVTVALEYDSVTAKVCLRVSDNGVGLPDNLDWRHSVSLGLRLVHILSGQLRGTVETSAGPGTDFKITFFLKGV